MRYEEERLIITLKDMFGIHRSSSTTAAAPFKDFRLSQQVDHNSVKAAKGDNHHAVPDKGKQSTQLRGIE